MPSSAGAPAHLAIRDGRLDCADRANEPAPNKQIYRSIADYVQNGGFVVRNPQGSGWDWSDMYMAVVPGIPPTNPDIPSVFVMVLGQCGQAPVQEVPVFEMVENPLRSGHWETEGGYPLSTYTMKID
jgi:hypothetical protein